MEQDSGIEEVVGEGGRRISRRTLIKGSAVVGATVWAAPVVESFTSKAFAASAAYYCCACSDPGNTGLPSSDYNQEESGAIPASVQDCVAYCNGTTNAQTTAYKNFIWCGPSSTAYLAGGSSSSYGCYNGGSKATGCTSGTIIYHSSGAYKSYTVTSKSASGVF